jgi:hypothetical protein
VGTKVVDPLRACVKVADYCNPSSEGTLTCVKSLEIFVRTLCQRIRTIRNSGSFLLLLVRTIRRSCNPHVICSYKKLWQALKTV